MLFTHDVYCYLTVWKKYDEIFLKQIKISTKLSSPRKNPILSYCKKHICHLTRGRKKIWKGPYLTGVCIDSFVIRWHKAQMLNHLACAEVFEHLSKFFAFSVSRKKHFEFKKYWKRNTYVICFCEIMQVTMVDEWYGRIGTDSFKPYYLKFPRFRWPDRP